jgi:predicted nucleic acid-binding protein
MKILIDTSAWIDFFNSYDSPERRTIAELVAGTEELCTCGVIVAEVFQGLRRDRSREDLQHLFRRLLFLEPSGIDLYLRAADIYRSLRRRGKTVRSTIDCLIAVLAEENACFVLSRDRDLRLILQSGLVKARLLNPGL